MSIFSVCTTFVNLPWLTTSDFVLQRYLVHLLENILVEARNVDDDEDEAA